MANHIQELGFGLFQSQLNRLKQLERQRRICCQQRFEILLAYFTKQRSLERLSRRRARDAEDGTGMAENFAGAEYSMHDFVTILAQSRDLHPAFLQKVDVVGRIAMNEDPLTAGAFCSSHRRIEAM